MRNNEDIQNSPNEPKELRVGLAQWDMQVLHDDSTNKWSGGSIQTQCGKRGGNGTVCVNKSCLSTFVVLFAKDENPSLHVG